MKLTRRFALLTTLALAAVPMFAAETWTVDKAHSSVGFKVRHMMANTTGNFRDFDAVINIDRTDLKNSNVQFTIQAASIDTASENRDKHLRSADFFDVEKFPTITFKSTSIAKGASKDLYNVTGDFTMHGVTKRITLPVQYLGNAVTKRGEVAGFEIETTVNRKDYGVVWNRDLDAGGVLLGDDVKVTINLEVNKKVAAPAAAPAAK